MIQPYLIELDTDAPSLEDALKAGGATLLYLWIGDRSSPVGRELFYTHAVPEGYEGAEKGEPHVVTAGALSDLEDDLSARVARCEGQTWHKVFERLGEFR